MTKTQRILAAVALAAGASALAAPGASAAVGTGPVTQAPNSLSQLDKLNELGQVTGALAPVTQVLGSVQ
ncbi:hypothetical protein [Streptomyces sp. NPDC020681]|uniref:hypothetical protein n=1 Tax=Streptomyces sp. NPDC020681 TaxID=3365083 RepID=UPI0037B7D8AE